jgi:CRISPR-associated endonuclease/helicase Cas3
MDRLGASLEFPSSFRSLTGFAPFRWQERLFSHLISHEPPSACDIPTGLGKTSVIPIWLLALAAQSGNGQPSLPRRLIYVVDRRTVVDQATDIAERLRETLRANGEGQLAPLRRNLSRLSGNPERPLSISTLRGELADNREWQEDPGRAAIIVGTVDMIGSRLLFSGYGVSRRMRPFHAGLLGQDTLLVHDEAHLSPAFDNLIKKISEMQKAEARPLRVLRLSATQRESDGNAFVLTEEEKAEDLVARRLRATKLLKVVDTKDGARPEVELAERALVHDPQRVRVIVYVRTPILAKDVAHEIEKTAKGRVAVLTGTIRGHERDQMVNADPATIANPVARRRAEIFRGFRTDPKREWPPATVYLVATSAGEVGVDLDADHMVADLTTLDSMIQRLGRVNRLGEGSATATVVEWKVERKGGSEDYRRRMAATRAALERLPALGDGNHDASPAALAELVGKRLTPEEREACFSEMPRMVELTDILLDGWSMTSVEALPGSPPPERWLHGVTSEPPSTYVAWRWEVDDIVGAADPRSSLQVLIESHPILARARLRGRLDAVIDEFKKIARRVGDRPVVVVAPRGATEIVRLDDLVKKDREEDLREATVVLPPEAGGLDGQGMLDGSSKDVVEDVADAPGRRETAGHSGTPERRRVLVWRNPETAGWAGRSLGTGETLDLRLEAAAPTKPNAVVSAVLRALPRLAEKERIVLDTDEDTGRPARMLVLLEERRSIGLVQNNPAAAAGKQTLKAHLQAVRNAADELARRIGPLATNRDEAERLAEVTVLAAAWHDRGKDRDPWQADIGNPRQRGNADWEPLAKSGRRGFVSRLSGNYRHEFGSLREAAGDPAIAGHPERDLILHLVASHHGWARPHFLAEHGDIADDVAFGENEALASETLRRFGRLQRRFGRWGLAWLESILRAADYRVSRGLEATDDGGEQ